LETTDFFCVGFLYAIFIIKFKNISLKIAKSPQNSTSIEKHVALSFALLLSACPLLLQQYTYILRFSGNSHLYVTIEVISTILTIVKQQNEYPANNEIYLCTTKGSFSSGLKSNSQTRFWQNPGFHSNAFLTVACLQRTF